MKLKKKKNDCKEDDKKIPKCNLILNFFHNLIAYRSLYIIIIFKHPFIAAFSMILKPSSIWSESICSKNRILPYAYKASSLPNEFEFSKNFRLSVYFPSLLQIFPYRK